MDDGTEEEFSPGDAGVIPPGQRALLRNIEETIDHVCRIIERENPDLDGVLTNTKYNDEKSIQKLRKLISHFNSPRLRNKDLESTDIFGDAFEYLIFLKSKKRNALCSVNR